MAARTSERPVSDNQLRYVKAELSGLGSYMIAMGHLVEGPFDTHRFRRACAELVKRHEELRTSFALTNGEMRALVSDEPHFQIHFTAFEDTDFSVFRKWVLPLVYRNVNPLTEGSLVRFFAAELSDSWRFMIAVHHSIADGFSKDVMMKELLKFYVDEPLPPVESYYDFHASLNEHEVTPAPLDVDDLPNPVRLVGDGVKCEADVGQYVAQSFPHISKPLRAMAKSVGATRFGVISAVYALGLHGYSGETALSSFFQSEGRKSLEAPNNVIGSFSNTLPLDLSIDLDQTFANFASTLSKQIRDRVAKEQEPLLDAVVAAGKAPSVSLNLYPPVARIKVGGLTVGPREFLDRRTEYDLNLVWVDDRGETEAKAFYNPAQITACRARQFLEFQGRLIAAALSGPHLSCRDILKSARAGRESASARVDPVPNVDRRLHERFFDWVERKPDATALITTDAKWTYRALAERVYAYLQGLKLAGVGAADTVVLFTERNPDLAAAMLAVSASGAAFAIVDSDYPVARVRYMLDQLGTAYVIEIGDVLPFEVSQGMARITPIEGGDASLVVGSAPRQKAYHLFTSGTTGRPRQVTHPDQTVQRFISWQTDTLALDGPVITMMMAGLSHDPTLRDILLPLSHGGAVAVPSPTEMTTPALLCAFVGDAGCTVIRFSASTARLLMTGADRRPGLNQLKAIFWGGERLQYDLVDQWREISPNAQQFNVFGLSETPQAFLIHEIEANETRRRQVPIGKTLPWTGIFLSSSEGMPVSVGEVGEIVAELADPVIGTKDPFATDPGAPLRRHFTGDYGFQLEDGAFCYAGRRDDQVKINGYRVELGELEATAEGIKGVDRARALQPDEHLHLFVQTVQSGVDEAMVRATLARSLPAYMMPTRIMLLDQFPVTPNGKVDEVALSALAQNADEASATQGAGTLQGEIEQAIGAILSRHSGRRNVARNQSLADLSADSLSTIEARLDLEAMDVALPDDWPWRSVAELADCRTTTMKSRTFLAGLFLVSRIETFLLMRCLAIVLIVGHHSGVQIAGGGASITLFTLAGHAFARLQLPAILGAEHVGRVWASMARLLVVLIPISLAYYYRSGFPTDVMELSNVLLYRNLVEIIDVVVFQRPLTRLGQAEFWFLHAYLQIFLLLGVLLSFPKIRLLLSSDMWRSLTIFFIISEVFSIVCIAGAAYWQGDFMAVSFAFRWSPTTVITFVAIGAVIASADTQRRLMISFGIAICHFGISYIGYIGNGELWWLVVMLVCAIYPFTLIPRFVSAVVIAVATHSLIIYLTHGITAKLFRKLFDYDASQIPSILFQVAFGIAVGFALRPVISKLGINRLAEDGRPGWPRLRSRQ